MNDAFDITSDPRNVDITNPALARMLDADLKFNQMPADVSNKFAKVDSITQERDSLPFRLDEEQIKEITQFELVKGVQT